MKKGRVGDHCDFDDDCDFDCDSDDDDLDEFYLL
jgi:hypothetical protein